MSRDSKDVELHIIAVSDGKSLSQPAWPREWKRCKEENE
jgi:hypothetical protein